jgi:hypothetical protein
MLVFALLEWKWRWRLSSGSGGGDGWKAFAPVIIYRAESDLQADAGVCFVGVEVEAQQWFWRSGRMESFRAGNYLSGRK